MTLTEAKDYCRENGMQIVRQILKPDKDDSFVCPVCGSGSGKNGTGLYSKDGIIWTCWRGCFSKSDIFDIVGKTFFIDGFTDQVRKAAELMGITIENQNQPENKRITQQEVHNQSYTTKVTQSKVTQQEEQTDYTDFFLQANKDIEKTDYHRGLSLETLNHFNVGYVEKWKHPKQPKAVPSPRLIVPTSKYTYLARHASKEDYINYKGVEENKSKVGLVHIFNPDAIYLSQKPVFIVEGEIDAMSVYEVGGEAVGLGSTVCKKKLIELIKNNLEAKESKKPEHTLLLCLDNDGAGKDATKALKEALSSMKIPYKEVDIAGQYKDPNEALMKDREQFTAAVTEAENTAAQEELEAIKAEQERNIAELKKESVYEYLPGFYTEMFDKAEKPIPTGIKSVDKLLDGGFYPGLYVVGAISSLGKTTLCLQFADQMAKNGTDVLIFSLEMARKELMARSISRQTFVLYGDKQRELARSTREILTKMDFNKRDEINAVAEAVSEYGKYCGHIYITEGVGNVGIAEIKEKIERHIKVTGKAPVVIIDYLQIIAPVDPRCTDKQNTDKAVMELKRLSRDYSIPVIGVSSFNRESYTDPVDMSSFKESGAIEYSSDMLIGLQLYGMDYDKSESDKDRNPRIRDLIKKYRKEKEQGKPLPIQFKILKNRNGNFGDTVLSFYSRYNCFTELEEEKPVDRWKTVESTYK